jgi:hyperosmotically inducible protein
MKSNQQRVLNLTLAGVLGTFSAVALAAAPVMPDFKTIDSNADGKVTLEEFAAKGGQPQAFREGDANRDSHLSSDEYVKAVANNDRIKAGKFADDAWITAKIKTLLIKDEGMQGLGVKVDTHKGDVQLSGWANSPEQIARAEKIALGVDGVKGVRNNIQVKR